IGVARGAPRVASTAGRDGSVACFAGKPWTMPVLMSYTAPSVIRTTRSRFLQSGHRAGADSSCLYPRRPGIVGGCCEQRPDRFSHRARLSTPPKRTRTKLKSCHVNNEGGG